MTFDEDDEWPDEEMVIEGEDDGIPRIHIEKEQKRELRFPWKSCLIIKLLGKELAFNNLRARLLRLWALDSDIEFIDLGVGYYIVKFHSKHDMIKVLTEGPWRILGHYVLVQRWKPNFKPSTAALGVSAIWIRLPELEIEYFREEVLMNIGKAIGKPLRIDANTSLALRAKFARICVEVDLAKPLIPKILIDGVVQRIEYESIFTISFHCGVVGHRVENCLVKQAAESASVNSAVAKDEERRKDVGSVGATLCSNEGEA